MMSFKDALLGRSRQLGLFFRLPGPELCEHGGEDEYGGEGDEECSFHVIAGIVVMS
jgi:hypothetical protein